MTSGKDSIAFRRPRSPKHKISGDRVKRAYQGTVRNGRENGNAAEALDHHLFRWKQQEITQTPPTSTASSVEHSDEERTDDDAGVAKKLLSASIVQATSHGFCQNKTMGFSEEDMVFIEGTLFQNSSRKKKPQGNKGCAICSRYFVKNHMMINNERTKRRRVPLKRNPKLDEIATQHARIMAGQEKLSHPPLEKNMASLGCKRIAANVGRGSNIDSIHKSMTYESKSSLNNMMDTRFGYMGVGTAKDLGGQTIYLCQLFSG